MGHSMSDPTLDLFQKLSGAAPDTTDTAEDDKLYPGNTPPRNATDSFDKGEPDWLKSLPFQEMQVDKTGQTKRFYTIGAVASALGKKPVTIRSWEQKGWLPSASYRTPPPVREQIPGKTPRGKRLYSQDQLMFLVEAYGKYILDPAKANWPGFRTYIKRYYPKR